MDTLNLIVSRVERDHCTRWSDLSEFEFVLSDMCQQLSIEKRFASWVTDMLTHAWNQCLPSLSHTDEAKGASNSERTSI